MRRSRESATSFDQNRKIGVVLLATTSRVQVISRSITPSNLKYDIFRWALFFPIVSADRECPGAKSMNLFSLWANRARGHGGSDQGQGQGPGPAWAWAEVSGAGLRRWG